MPSLSRRGFLALGGTGAAGVALGACGSGADPRGEGDDPELLAAALGAEEALQAAYDNLALFAKGAAAKREFYAAQDARISELGRFGASIGESDTTGSDAYAALDATIAAYRNLARLGSTEELRTTATQFLAQVAVELATVRELQGDEVVPFAFVTGLDEPPLETTDDAPSGETTTTTDSTTSTGGG
jgi:hypothetical protein